MIWYVFESIEDDRLAEVMEAVYHLCEFIGNSVILVQPVVWPTFPLSDYRVVLEAIASMYIIYYHLFIQSISYPVAQEGDGRNSWRRAVMAV